MEVAERNTSSAENAAADACDNADAAARAAMIKYEKLESKFDKLQSTYEKLESTYEKLRRDTSSAKNVKGKVAPAKGTSSTKNVNASAQCKDAHAGATNWYGSSTSEDDA